MIEEQFQGIVARVLELIRKAWTGQITIEINLAKGGIASIYFTASETMKVSNGKKKRGGADVLGK